MKSTLIMRNNRFICFWYRKNFYSAFWMRKKVWTLLMQKKSFRRIENVNFNIANRIHHNFTFMRKCYRKSSSFHFLFQMSIFMKYKIQTKLTDQTQRCFSFLTDIYYQFRIDNMQLLLEIERNNFIKN